MSDLIRSLSRGDVVRGAGATTFSPAVVETYGSAGLDYVWLDFEHKGPSPSDSHALESLVRAAERAGVELLVRLPNAEPWLVRKVLDTGVDNLLFPRVETAQDVRRAARTTTFEYEGEPGGRGASNSRASDWGTRGFEPVNGDPGVGVMIETADAVENFDAILSVPGLDFAYLGAADLSVSLGRPFEMDHHAVREAVASVEKRCRATGTPLGRSVSTPQDVPEAVADGYRLLRFGDELGAVRRRLAEFDDELPPDATKD